MRLAFRRRPERVPRPVAHPPVTGDDGVIRELFSRIVADQRTITIDTTGPVEPGDVHWESAFTETGSRQTTIWFVPSAEPADPAG